MTKYISKLPQYNLINYSIQINKVLNNNNNYKTFLNKIKMNSSRINPQQKMNSLYVANLQNIIQSLCRIVKTLVQEDQIVFEAYEKLKENLPEIKYFQKIHQKSNKVSMNIQKIIQVISHHGHQQNIISQHFPPIKKNDNSLGINSLATIAQKESQENLLYNYLRKHNNIKPERYQAKTLHQPSSQSFQNNSSQFQVIRQQTRRSLANPALNSNRKPLYKELQKLKGADQIIPAVKNYMQKHNHKKQVISRTQNYQITKFI